MSEPLVSIIMGSQSDWETMQAATTVLTELGIPFEARVVSAHRTPRGWSSLPRARLSAGFRSSLPAPVARHIWRAWRLP